MSTDRYYSKRAAGISPTRSDGSRCSPVNDQQAAAAERYAAEVMGCTYNDAITAHGDGGHDFEFSLTVEVVWMGLDKTGQPRRGGHLIVNPYEPHRWADLYVVVGGSQEWGFSILGWTTHRKLAALPLRDFGYGPKMAMPIEQLEPLKRLLSLKGN
jgi:hypothetical protein